MKNRKNNNGNKSKNKNKNKKKNMKKRKKKKKGKSMIVSNLDMLGMLRLLVTSNNQRLNVVQLAHRDFNNTKRIV